MAHSPSNPERDFRPNATLELLRARHHLLQQLRSFFDQRGFLEVTTPVLSQDTVIDEHLDPFCVTCYGNPQQWQIGPTRYLQTSPEFHMKRILCAGADAIYQIGPAFRAAELGQWHNPEFTLLEWYRLGDDMVRGMHLLEQLVIAVTGCDRVERISYADAFASQLALNPHTAPMAQLQSLCGKTYDTGASRDDVLHYLWNGEVASGLGTSRPTLIFDYPQGQAALAEIRPGDPPLAERFELYWQGIELANGYHELRSAAALRSRSEATNEKRQKAGKMALPSESLLIEAMEHGLPPCAGVALGVDRLFMLLQGETILERVLTFAFPRA